MKKIKCDKKNCNNFILKNFMNGRIIGTNVYYFCEEHMAYYNNKIKSNLTK